MKFDFMKQAQELQKRMEDLQNSLDKLEIEAGSGGGLVKVIVTGKGDLVRIKVDPSLMKAEEKDILEDLIVAALADGKTKAAAKSAEEMSKITSGLSLPGGMKLPF